MFAHQVIEDLKEIANNDRIIDDGAFKAAAYLIPYIRSAQKFHLGEGLIYERP